MLADTIDEVDDGSVTPSEPGPRGPQRMGEERPVDRLQPATLGRRIPWVSLVVLLLAAVEGVIISTDQGPATRATVQEVWRLPAQGAGNSPEPVPVAPPSFVETDTIGHPLLGVAAGWELFGRGPVDVVRVQFASGTVTRTGLPALGGSGQVSFVVTRAGAVVRPTDGTPGYLVPDSGPARLLRGALAIPGPALPGTDLGHVWSAAASSRPPAFALTSVLEGSQSGSIPIPNGGSLAASRPDGAGGVLFMTPDGTYDGLPGMLRRVTTGSVIAIGSTIWLAEECDGRAVCTLMVIDRLTGGRRALGASLANWTSGGVVSPDGKTAALIGLGVGRSADLVLVDLSTGRERETALSVRTTVGDGVAAWSPDGRWVFAATSSGQVAAVDPRTAGATGLGVSLPPLSQVAIRAPR